MSYRFKLSRKISGLRAPLLAALIVTLAACDSADSLTSDDHTVTEAVDEGSTQDPLGSIEEDTPTAEDSPAMLAPEDGTVLASVSYAGGIPFGTYALPTAEFGTRYNGAMRNIGPPYLLSELAAIKSRGGKVALMLAGPEWYYKDADGHFSLTKWKARVDRFKNVNFSSYVTDGTIIGHYLIDEPQDPVNWNGQPIPPATIEAMAQYSKQRWPTMVTIARTWPDYLDNWSQDYRYLDAAWAQYDASRFPDTEAFIQTNVKKAQAKGLALVAGLNVIKGSPTKGQMSGTQVKTYGSTILGSTYICSFLSWQYRDSYMDQASVKDAMSYLRGKAQNRSFKTCRAP